MSNATDTVFCGLLVASKYREALLLVDIFEIEVNLFS
jgi:hypothetical protein